MYGRMIFSAPLIPFSPRQQWINGVFLRMSQSRYGILTLFCWAGAGLVLALAAGGCQRRLPPLPDLADPRVPAPGLLAYQAVVDVEAVCAPPQGWQPEPLKQSGQHTHQVWLSPSGKTAYGVIHVRLPLPVGPELVLWGFMREMRQSEGEAILLSRQRDPDLPGIRFVAEGGLYRIHTNLLVYGRRAWAVYAGTLREEEVSADELALAERARETTHVGLPEGAEELSRSGRSPLADE
jgi:hypothetical protein